MFTIKQGVAISAGYEIASSLPLLAMTGGGVIASPSLLVILSVAKNLILVRTGSAKQSKKSPLPRRDS